MYPNVFYAPDHKNIYEEVICPINARLVLIRGYRGFNRNGSVSHMFVMYWVPLLMKVLERNAFLLKFHYTSCIKTTGHF